MTEKGTTLNSVTADEMTPTTESINTLTTKQQQQQREQQREREQEQPEAMDSLNPEDAMLSTSPDSANGELTLGGGNQRPLKLSLNGRTLEGYEYEPPTQDICHCPSPTSCVTLKNIVESFKAPISEEQAWAVIHQFTALFRRLATAARLAATHAQQQHVLRQQDLPEAMEQLCLHRDGTVHVRQQQQQTTKQVGGGGAKAVCGEAMPMRSRNGNAGTNTNTNTNTKTAKTTTTNTNTNTNTNTTKRIMQSMTDQAFEDHHHHHQQQQHSPAAFAIQKKIIQKLAIIVYTALDYNLQDDEQCQMSQELEELITYMTADANENDDDCDCIDEGIDEGDKRWDDDNDDDKYNETKEFDYILEACKNHVKPMVPDDHYKAVCRALVTETIELRVFLQHVFNNGAEVPMPADSQTSQQELANLGFGDWARFWVQVIDELRRGVRLKKNNYTRTPIEYELTPYEILMEDIRTKKYQLRKVMVNGDIPPRVKKDAHALILEFIRSRPPLKKASERKLPPPIQRTPSPREQLMDSIRKGRKLKHITPVPLPRLKDRLLPTAAAAAAAENNPNAKSGTALLPTTSTNARPIVEFAEAPRSKQRLIKVDFSLLQDDDNFFDELSNSSSTTTNSTTRGNCSQPQMPPYPIGGYLAAAATRSGNTGQQQAAPMRSTQRRTYDLATQCESRRASLRRHTIVGCQSNFEETVSMPTTRPSSRQDVPTEAQRQRQQQQQQQQQQTQQQQQQNTTMKRTKSPATSSMIDDDSTAMLSPWNKSFLDKQTWMERGDDQLSLTLEEIVHIRSVMTKAELEALPVGVRIKEDVEKRKVCFLCLRTRFSIFGPWGIQCKLCQRTVCSKCYTKMRIPSEHFRNVPLVLISPTLLSSPGSSSTPSPSHYVNNKQHSSSTGNILDEQFPKSLIERLLRSESERKTRNTVGSAPSSPKHQRSNMSTPAHAQQLAAPQHAAVEALQEAAGCGAGSKSNSSNTMSRSMEGPRSLPVNSPARTLSNNSTLERKNRFARGFTFTSSGGLLGQVEKENLRGELVPVCHDCQGLVNEISSSAKQKRSSARNRTLMNLTLDLAPVWK